MKLVVCSSMDAIDIELIKLLIQDCRMSYRDLSDRVGISRTAVKKRIDNMVESNIIHKFTVRLSQSMTGMEYLLAILEFDSPLDEASLFSSLEESPLITQVSKTFDERFAVFGVYFTNDDLSGLTTMFWGLKNIKDVKLFPKFLRDKGGKIELTRVHMMILRCLMEDARLSVSSISELTGLTPRKVTSAMTQMRKSRAVVFTIRLTENVTSKGTEVVTVVGWDVKKTSLDEMKHYLQNEFRENYIAADPLATEPTILVEFTVMNIQDIEKISQILQESGFVTSVESLLLYPTKRFSDPRVRKLDAILSEAGY